MFKLLIILSFLSVVAYAGKHNECRKKIALYEAMQCSPIHNPKKSSKGNCPEKYDCSFVMYTPPDKCHFQGKYYAENEVLEDEKTSTSRLVSCKCKKQNDGSDFICEPLECLESENDDSNCYEYFEKPLDGCPTKIQCPPFDDLHKCDFHGRPSLEGLLFSPVGKPCTLCVCQKDTKTIECGNITCASEAGHSMEIRNYYAPLYISSTPCCPYRWTPLFNFAPQPIDKVISPGRKKGPKCRFGEKVINNGKVFQIHDGKIKITCTCKIPPLVTCIAPM